MCTLGTLPMIYLAILKSKQHRDYVLKLWHETLRNNIVQYAMFLRSLTFVLFHFAIHRKCICMKMKNLVFVRIHKAPKW